MNFDLKFYWGLLLKRLPVMLALFMVCVVGASVTALKMPPTYSTSAQLLVEEPQIPIAVRSQIDAGQQLQVIEQRLLTRANLLDIARKHSVFEDINSMTPDAIVDGMRAQTRIRRSGGRGQATLMQVSFEARWGQIAADVVNEYVTLILQESTDFRMRRAEGALEFFEQEVKRLSEDLDLQSARIVAFKSENTEALPGDLTYRQNRQALLQERQARLERETAALRAQRSDMIAIFESTGNVNATATVPQTPEQQQLQQMKLDLNQALSVYSKNNPRIVLLRQRIAQLEEIVAQQVSLAPTDGEGPARAPTVFEMTLAEMDQRISNLNSELESVTAELSRLEASIQDTAGNTITLDALERDFRNISARYNEAVANLNQARVTERIEVNAQGQRISVIENATVPQEPSGPNRFRMIAMGILAGTGLAGGFFVLLELLNITIRRPAELQSKFGITPLAIVPYMESRRERLVRRAALVCALLAVLVCVPLALWYIDTQYMSLDILAQRVFSRLGLT